MQLGVLLLGQILVMMVMVLVGAIMARCGLVNGEESRIISRVVVYVITCMRPSAATLTQMTQIYRNLQRGCLSSINAATTVLCSVTMPVMIVRLDRQAPPVKEPGVRKVGFIFRK